MSTVASADLFVADRPADMIEPEIEIVRDIARRALPVVPVILAVGALAAGIDGALSAAVGIALVLANFVTAAASLVWAGRINFALLMGVALFGYVVRISVLFGAVFLLRDLAWVHLLTLGCTMVVTHLGLLAWELKYVSASLAHPGLKPGTVHPEPHHPERSPQQ